MCCKYATVQLATASGHSMPSGPSAPSRANRFVASQSYSNIQTVRDDNPAALSERSSHTGDTVVNPGPCPRGAPTAFAQT